MQALCLSLSNASFPNTVISWSDFSYFKYFLLFNKLSSRRPSIKLQQCTCVQLIGTPTRNETKFNTIFIRWNNTARSSQGRWKTQHTFHWHNIPHLVICDSFGFRIKLNIAQLTAILTAINSRNGAAHLRWKTTNRIHEVQSLECCHVGGMWTKNKVKRRNLIILMPRLFADSVLQPVSNFTHSSLQALAKFTKLHFWNTV